MCSPFPLGSGQRLNDLGRVLPAAEGGAWPAMGMSVRKTQSGNLMTPEFSFPPVQTVFRVYQHPGSHSEEGCSLLIRGPSAASSVCLHDDAKS